MIIPCPPIIHLVATRIFHRLAHGLRHASHRVVRRTSGAVNHAFKPPTSPHFITGFACKMGSAAILAGGLLTGLPTNTPLSSDGATSSVDGASRSSTTPSENSGALDQASPRIWIVGSGSAPVFPAIEPGGPTTYAPGDSPAFSDPFAFRGPSLFAGSEVARDLRPVLNELPADLAPGFPGGDPDSPATVPLSVAPVDEPSSGLILLAALISLSLRRSTTLVVCPVPGGAGL
jgi:hypothetical protein